MASEIGPLSHGPLVDLTSLPKDAPRRSKGSSDPKDDLAPWVSTWRKAYVEPLHPTNEEGQRWATVVNRHPHSKAGAGVPPQLGIAPIVFGAGTFGTGQYFEENLLQSREPVRAVRLALQYGINAFDASPFYRNSEAILGRALAALKPEFPRSSYYISTKCGRYGPTVKSFDYSASRVRKSVEESLIRLDAEGWLDNVFMHDAEFICTPVGPAHDAGMGSATVVSSDLEAKQKVKDQMGIDETWASASKVHGKGDEQILEAVRELFNLKDEGKIKMVGLSGYPLPVLLRLARMVATNAPFRPLDSLLSYSHHTLHADTLSAYLELFQLNPWSFPGAPESEEKDKWVPPLVMNASPFSMGLLTETGPPRWHPATQNLFDARDEGLDKIKSLPPPPGQDPVTLAETALYFGIRGSEVSADPTSKEVQSWTSDLSDSQNIVPSLRTLTGLANTEQVDCAVEAYRTLFYGRQVQKEKVLPFPPADKPDAYVHRSLVIQQAENLVLDSVRARRIYGETWESPPASARDGLAQ